MKEIDIFYEPVRIRLTRKKLFDKSQKETEMFKGSKYGGCITISIVLVVIIFIKSNLTEMLNGS